MGGRCFLNCTTVLVSLWAETLGLSRSTALRGSLLHRCRREGRKKNKKKIGAHSRVPREPLTGRKAAFRSHRGETKQKGE